MSVGRRLMLSLVILVSCTGVLGLMALVGLQGLSHEYRMAEEQYQDLRSLYEVGFRAASIRAQLNARSIDLDGIRAHLEIAAQEADKLATSYQARGSAPVNPAADRVRRSVREHLDMVTLHVDSGEATAGLETDVNRWLGEVVGLVGAAQAEIVQSRARASTQLRTVLLCMAGAMIVTVLVALVVGVRQYRSVMGPLRVLDSAVTRIADVDLDHRLPEQGDLEFARLIAHFNSMSVTIGRLHSSMREQVETKSRQLVRSEQLAGVGSLAAGLAHEINNPLGIIAGYAQTTRRRLLRPREARDAQKSINEATEALGVISEEAFRARDIVRQLLDMAQPAADDAEPVPLAPLVLRAADLVRHLPVARGRELNCDVDGLSDALAVRGHAPHLLQVFINLLTNGLEAVASDEGKVIISAMREGNVAIIAVSDDGCGMDAKTLARAFDPFFTDKPKRGLSGCGLGLSVSHALVERHGGRLYARSEGPGRGSTFSVELPIELSATGMPDRQECEHVGIS